MNFENMIERMLAVEQTLEVQLSIGVLFAIFWGLFFELVYVFHLPWMKTRKWYNQMLSIMEYNGKNFGILQNDMPKGEWHDFLAALYSHICSATVQHFVSGLCAFPMVLGIDTYPYTGLHAYQWTMLGGLGEAGWEVYDLSIRTLRGQPSSIIVVLALHHAIAQLMVIPCNLYLLTWGYAASIANLQCIAAFALALQCYGRTIDLTQKSQATVMACTYCFYAIVNILNRGFLFVYISYTVILEIIEAEYWVMLGVGLLGATCSLIFNFLMIYDGVLCACKYYKLAWGNVKEEERKELVRQLTEEMGAETAEKGKQLVKQLTGSGAQLVKQLTGTGSSLVRQLTGGAKAQLLNQN